MPLFDFESDVDFWIRFATMRHVRELTLSFDVQGCVDVKLPTIGFIVCPAMHYQLPGQLYRNDTIQHMELHGCFIFFSPSVNWKSLISLYIDNSILRNDIIRSITQGSPSLETLEIHDCWGFSAIDAAGSTSLKTLVINATGSKEDGPPTLDIDAPSIKSLTLMGYFSSTICRVLRVSSSLQEAELILEFDECDDADFYREFKLMLINLLRSLAHATFLTVGNYCLKVLSLNVTESMSFPSLSSKCLTLENMLGKCMQRGITTLLECSMKLEILRLDSADNSHGQDEHPPSACDNHWLEDFCWMSQKDLKHQLQELKNVELFDAIDRRSCHVGTVNAFARYLRRNTPIMQELTIFGQTTWPDRSLINAL